MDESRPRTLEETHDASLSLILSTAAVDRQPDLTGRGCVKAVFSDSMLRPDRVTDTHTIPGCRPNVVDATDTSGSTVYPRDAQGADAIAAG